MKMVNARLLLVFCTIFLSVLCVTSKQSVGIWVDDGDGKTVKIDLPPIESRLLMKYLRDALNIPQSHHQTRQFRGKVNENQSSLIYMKNIYTYKNMDKNGKVPNLDQTTRSLVDSANIILSHQVSNSYFSSNQSEDQQRSTFKLTGLPQGFSVLGAELRIFREPSPKYDGQHLLIHVYNGTKAEKNDRNKITTAVLPNSGWVSLNMTAFFHSWVSGRTSKLEFKVVVTRPNGSVEDELQFNETGLAGENSRDEMKPFVVLYLYKKPEESPISLSRLVRSAVRTLQNRHPFSPALLKPLSPNTPCQIFSMHVTINELGYNDWIIAPKAYDAYFCYGKCTLPFFGGLNATNHAVVQAFVKMKRAYAEGQEPPDTCCAPMEQSVMSILSYNPNESPDAAQFLIRTSSSELIVDKCGCV